MYRKCYSVFDYFSCGGGVERFPPKRIQVGKQEWINRFEGDRFKTLDRTTTFKS
jgi:hypothetical protein